ncbi:MAG: hypothetical protein ABI718_14100 [Acidobacteriota bacterium]
MKLKTGFLLIMFLGLAGCGKKGNPTPPVPIIPKAVSDLAVAQRGPEILLSWSYPAMTTTGKKLEMVRSITILRYTENLPPSALAREPVQAVGAGESGTPRVIELFKEIPAIPPQQFAKLAATVTRIGGDEIPAHSEGARLFYADDPPVGDSGNQPIRMTYAVVTSGPAGKSDLSNLASIVPLQVSVPPADVVARPDAAGVSLTWARPATAVTAGYKPDIAGFNVYRVAASGKAGTLDSPINNAPVLEPSYKDAPPLGVWQYRVTAVSAYGPPLVQSDASEAVVAEFRDLVPPPQPVSISALVEESAIRALWDAVVAPDLKGYKVYRTVIGGPRTLLTPQPITDTNIRDTQPTRGSVYRYWVSSVDTSGNESAATPTDPVLFPR